jgi:sulfur-oxidizing protein SoxY
MANSYLGNQQPFRWLHLEGLQMGHKLSRREALRLAAGTAILAAAAPAAARPEDATKAIAAFTGGRAAEETRITLDLAEAVEDGNSVPLAVAVDSPMRPDDYVSDVLVVSEENPWPRVARFQFTPLSGRAAFSTRIRLTASQNVIVLAKTHDGRLYMAKKHVNVTIGACAP